VDGAERKIDWMARVDMKKIEIRHS
jgi:hypothetical protein